MREAGVVLVGGHTVEDPELKYGLSVTGFIHPERILTKNNLKPGDHLILTKPLGTGIINTAIKGGLASKQMIALVTECMATLNKNAADVMAGYPVHACTDITGFGFLGHLSEMVVGSGCGARIGASSIPVFPETTEYAGMGLVPAGAYRNREFRLSMVDFAPTVDRILQDVLFDPQTSGGLLLSIAPERAKDLLHDLRAGGIHDATIVGEVVAEPRGRILVQ
jgi:selenide, water dikinase